MLTEDYLAGCLKPVLLLARKLNLSGFHISCKKINKQEKRIKQTEPHLPQIGQHGIGDQCGCKRRYI
jgi:hypothetical protein